MGKAVWWLSLGAWLGALTVALGAFGAHGLKGHIDQSLFANWQTATDYLGLHALALLACGLILLYQPKAVLVHWAALTLALGVLLFSGSLFALGLTGIRQFGWITPLGGSALILGWVLLALGAARLTH